MIHETSRRRVQVIPQESNRVEWLIDIPDLESLVSLAAELFEQEDLIISFQDVFPLIIIDDESRDLYRT